MAVALTNGHVNRALDFYNRAGKYFIIGGTSAWENEDTPPAPDADEYKLLSIIGLKRVDNCQLVVPDENGSISYRTQNWRIVPESVTTTVTEDVVSGSSVIKVNSLVGITVGCKLRVNNLYDGVVTQINSSNSQVTLNSPAPATVASGSPVQGGALVEGAKYVYIDAYLNYDKFPIATYRQVGVCVGVTPITSDVLRAAAYATGGADEWTSLGVLEVLDNRQPNVRDIDQRELLSLIVEF